MVVESESGGGVYTVAFHPDGKHFFGGTENAIRRWRVADGQEVGKQTGMDMNAISVSRDGKWVVCGTTEGASVWDAELQRKVVEVEDTNWVDAVDVSPESTRFATGTDGRPGKASIWSITTGERLAGTLEDDRAVKGIKFSPDGKHIATACADSIHIFDSYNGNQLITIDILMPDGYAFTPIVWPSDGQLFATSKSGKIKSFDTSTGSQLAEWKADSGNVEPIAMSANARFIASSAGHSVSFWDTSTHTQLGSPLEDVDTIRSIALSPDGARLATGGYNGTITICNLSDILPEPDLPITVSTTFPTPLRLITFVYHSTFYKPLSSLNPGRKWSSFSVVDSASNITCCFQTKSVSTHVFVIQVFLRLTYGTQVPPDTEIPEDQPSQHDEQNSPQVGSSCRWMGELITIYVQVVAQQPGETHSNPPELETGSQDDDDAILEVKFSTVAGRRRFADGGNRSSCPRVHPGHYSTTMRYVATGSLLPRVNNTLEPPSPESRENPLESGPPAPDSSTANALSSSGPPMIPSVEMQMPDPKRTSDNPASSEGTRRTVGEWFRRVTTKRSHNQTSRQTPSEAPPQPRIPSQTKATPSKETPSTMAPGKRQAVSVSSSFDTGNGYLTARLSGQFTVVDQRLVHVSYPFMNTITYRASQKKKTKLPKTAPHSEAGPSKVPDETKAEPPGAKTNVEVTIHCLRLTAGTHNNSSSQLNRPRPLLTRKLVSPMSWMKRNPSLLMSNTT